MTFVLDLEFVLQISGFEKQEKSTSIYSLAVISLLGQQVIKLVKMEQQAVQLLLSSVSVECDLKFVLFHIGISHFPLPWYLAEDLSSVFVRAFK